MSISLRPASSHEPQPAPSRPWRRAISARTADRLATGSLWASAGIVVLVFAYLVLYTVARGAPAFSFANLFSSDQTVGLAPQLFNTFYLLLLAMVPMLIIGLGAALYTVEYARQGWLLAVLRFAVEALTSIPSIVIGLLGFLLFVTNFGAGQRWGFSRIAGALALIILNLPWMLRLIEDALRAVPVAYREASMALGATRLQTLWRVVLPSAVPGLATAVLIVAGRVVGESAALIYTAGSAGSTTGWLTPQLSHVAGDTLAVHIWNLFADNPTPQSVNGQTETALVLIVLVLALNVGARVLAGRLRKRFAGK